MEAMSTAELRPACPRANTGIERQQNVATTCIVTTGILATTSIVEPTGIITILNFLTPTVVYTTS
jgi:hypothetical protein